MKGAIQRLLFLPAVHPLLVLFLLTSTQQIEYQNIFQAVGDVIHRFGFFQMFYSHFFLHLIYDLLTVTISITTDEIIQSKKVQQKTRTQISSLTPASQTKRTDHVEIQEFAPSPTMGNSNDLFVFILKLLRAFLISSLTFIFLALMAEVVAKNASISEVHQFSTFFFFFFFFIFIFQPISQIFHTNFIDFIWRALNVAPFAILFLFLRLLSFDLYPDMSDRLTTTLILLWPIATITALVVSSPNEVICIVEEEYPQRCQSV
jgi:hypothetical protein